jgi:hypothetical protein
LNESANIRVTGRFTAILRRQAASDSLSLCVDVVIFAFLAGIERMAAYFGLLLRSSRFSVSLFVASLVVFVCSTLAT